MDNVVLAASSYVDLFFKILTVAIGLGLVIFFHELGHFAVAKWCNVLVERFSIGFGPILWRRKWGETEYALSAVPFGGYVKMLGQDDIDPGQMTDDQVATDPRSYSSKSVPQRMAIISAGVTMNIITGLMFFALAFRWGIDVGEPQVGTVRTGMSAWQNGLREGDTITSMNGRKVDEFYDILRQTALSRGDINIVGKHADDTTFNVTFSPDRNEFRRMIGIGPELSLKVPRVREPDYPFADPGSPAAKVDFQPRDEIVEVAGRPVKTHQEMMHVLSEKRDEPVTFVVNRRSADGKSTSRVEFVLDPQPFRRLGIRMSIGKVVAVRHKSPASEADIQPGDLITDVDGQDVGKELDPMRLPDYFSAKAGQAVFLKIKREARKEEPRIITTTLTPEPRLAWSEPPEMSEKSVLSIPSLGLAFDVLPSVLTVDPDGPAADLKLQPGDSIVSMSLPKSSPEAAARKVQISEVEDGKPYSSWPFAFWVIQNTPAVELITLEVRSPGTDLSREVVVKPVSATDWNMPTTRGLNLSGLTREKKAGSTGEACAMSLDHTRNSVIDIYLTLRNLVVGDLSVKSLHGPIGIAKTAAIFAEEGLPDFLLFLGLISINLAVINFLPIPVLDGGHMVFLIWEGLTRRRPSERVVVAATYVGLAFVASLMVAVIYIDLFVVKK